MGLGVKNGYITYFVMEAPIFEHLKYEIRRKGHEIGGNGCRKMRYLEVDNQI
jgi:hypothetical protein